MGRSSMNDATRRRRLPGWAVTGLALALACTALGSAQSARADPTPSTLTVALGGDGAGTITSDTGGVDCSAGTCTAPFDPAAAVTLTATPAAGSAFTGFGGGTCTGLTCTVLMTADTTVTADFDRRPTIAAPADGTAYAQASVPAAGYACAAGDTSCTATLDGAATPIGNGDPLAATPGAHTLTVSGVAADGATVTQTASYGVVAPLVGRAPNVVVTAPVDNAAYLWTAIPAADFTCIAGVGSTVQSCEPPPAASPLRSPGAAQRLRRPLLTVTATDADGLSSTANVTYTVTKRQRSAPPPCTIRAPAQGASYRLGQAVAARYFCLATSSGPALRSCIGTVPAGRTDRHRDAGRAPLQRVRQQRPGRFDDRDGQLQGRAHHQPVRRGADAGHVLGSGAAGAEAAGTRLGPGAGDGVERGRRGLRAPPRLWHGERGRPPGRAAGARSSGPPPPAARCSGTTARGP